MEVIGIVIAGIIVLPILAVLAVTVAVPLFWLWMLVDSVLREDWEYPSGNQNEKLLWIVLMIVFQISALAYYFMVFRELRRGDASARPYAATTDTVRPAAPAPPTTA